MRGKDTQQSSMFGYVSPEDRVPARHPLRPVRMMVDEALRALSPVFDQMYVAFGRPSIAPEKLLRALLLQILYTRSRRRMARTRRCQAGSSELASIENRPSPRRSCQ